MLAFFGVIFVLAGLLTLGVSTTMFGQIAGLVLWVIAALFLVGHVVVGAIKRETLVLVNALEMHARATTKATDTGSPLPPRSAPPAAPQLVERKTLGERFADWWRS